MKTVLNKETSTSIINRIYLLTASQQAVWGKMSPYQMAKHCSMMDSAFQNNDYYKPLFIGKLLGKMILKQILKNELPMKKNQPSAAYFIVTDSGDFEALQKDWVSLISNYPNFQSEYNHPFFGKMTKDQIGQFVYKHTDHHLRQFGV